MARTPGIYDRVVRSVCSPNCTGTCGVLAYVRNDRIVKLEPASFPDPGYERICLRGISMATQRLHHPSRLTAPLIRSGERGAGSWREVSWPEAYEYLAQKMRTIADRYGWRANSWLTMSGNYSFKATTSADRVANCLGGTAFSRGGLSSDIAIASGYFPILGDYYRSNDFSEVAGAKYVLSVGRNVADTAHSEIHFLFDAMEQGCKFVMIDPRFSRSAAKADEWVAPRPGTDGALAMAMINVVVTSGLMKRNYVLAYTNAPFLVRRDTNRCLRACDLWETADNSYVVWDDISATPVRAGDVAQPALSRRISLRVTDGSLVDCYTCFDACWDVLEKFTSEHGEAVSGVPADKIRKLASEYATADPAWIWLGYGAQRYSQGHTMVRAWVTLASLCGNIGKPYAGVSTSEGPHFLLGLAPPAEWMMPGGKKGHSLPGTQMVDIIATEQPYPIKSLWIQSYNFSSQSPLFKRFLSEALPNLELFAVSEQMMTRTAEYADIVLPVVSYYEDDWDLVGSAENWFIQLRRRVIPPIGLSRNDFDIFGGLCATLDVDPEDWRGDPEEACRWILANHSDPRIRAVDWETLKRDGVARVPVERPYTPFRDLKFATPSGRIEIYQEQFADVGEHVLFYREPSESHRSPNAARFPLTLITYKHVHSTHSQHTILPFIREVLPEPRMEVSIEDAATRSLGDGDYAAVFNDRGTFKVKVTVTNAVRPGTVALPEGWWHRHFAEGHPGDLGHIPHSEVQSRVMETNWAAYDVLCDVRKVNEPCPANLPL